MDNFPYALVQLESLRAILFGGHYEPLSDRDFWLAHKINILLKEVNKHEPT
jgi:hypothetical protein